MVGSHMRSLGSMDMDAHRPQMEALTVEVVGSRSQASPAPFAMTGVSYLVLGSGWPSAVILAVAKQAIPAGKAMPDCAERVQMFPVTSTAFGLS